MDDDIPLTRETIESVASKRYIYTFLALAMLSGLLFVCGLFLSQTQKNDPFADAPDWAVMMAVGMGGFSLFFPWFTALYFARHLLLSVKTLERDLAELRTETHSREHGASDQARPFHS